MLLYGADNAVNNTCTVRLDRNTGFVCVVWSEMHQVFIVFLGYCCCTVSHCGSVAMEQIASVCTSGGAFLFDYLSMSAKPATESSSLN